MIGFRSVGIKQMGESSAGNPHAAFDVAGAGNVARSRYLGRSRRASPRPYRRGGGLNPNAALAWEERGWTYQVAGQPEEAIRSFERAIRLSPFDPWLFSTFTGMGIAFIDLGRFDEAVAAAKNALQKNQTYGAAYRCLAAALTHLGRDAEARKTVTQILENEPDLRISEMVARSGQRSQMFFDGLRKAGFPE